MKCLYHSTLTLLLGFLVRPTTRYDEAGYLALPPCLWGDAEEGLQPSVFLGPNTPMISIKKNRNTDMGHYGEWLAPSAMRAALTSGKSICDARGNGEACASWVL